MRASSSFESDGGIAAEHSKGYAMWAPAALCLRLVCRAQNARVRRAGRRTCAIGGSAGEGLARPSDRDRARWVARPLQSGRPVKARAMSEREAAMKTDPSPGATVTDAGALGRRVG